ncbi:MAG: ABC transporter ATP-binding protein [Acidimicrobiales bacterium]
MTLLRLDGLAVRYGEVAALRGISLDVADGEIVTLLGGNGAGKTTTLRAISGLIEPCGGRVLFDGEDLAGVPSHRRVAMGICQTPEGRRIFAGMSVLENLEMGAYVHRLRRRGLAADLERVFGLFPALADRQDQSGGTLSGGEQQMLALGRALMARPRLLLLDEPSMGLAPKLVSAIFSVIDDINAQGTTVLLVEQNAAQALAHAARAYVLEVGMVVREGKTAALLADDSIRAAYLGGDVGTAR